MLGAAARTLLVLAEVALLAAPLCAGEFSLRELFSLHLRGTYTGSGAKMCASIAPRNAPFTLHYVPPSALPPSGPLVLETSRFLFNDRPCYLESVPGELVFPVQQPPPRNHSDHSSWSVIVEHAKHLDDIEFLYIGSGRPVDGKDSCANKRAVVTSTRPTHLVLRGFVVFRTKTAGVLHGPDPRTSLNYKAHVLYVVLNLDLPQYDGSGTLCFLRGIGFPDHPVEGEEKRSASADSQKHHSHLSRGVVIMIVVCSVALTGLIAVVLAVLHQRRSRRAASPTPGGRPVQVQSSTASGHEVVIFADDD